MSGPASAFHLVDDADANIGVLAGQSAGDERSAGAANAGVGR
jgi:hypothetical protein